MTRTATIIALLCALLPAAAVRGAEPDEAVHEELRALRRGLLAAVEQSDIEGMLQYLHPDVVVTFMDGRQCHGRDEVRAYFERMLQGEERVVDSYAVSAEVAELTALYGGDFGTAYGSAESRFDLTDGRKFTVRGPWTATVVRQDGRWLVAAFHSSTNMFDNAILDIAKQWIVWGAVIAGVVGLLVGLAVGRLLRRRRPAAEGARPS